MFIETLEFTIPMDLCDLFTTMKRGPRSNLEFPASVNSYGTTQDANIQVVVRSNKLTFKVDGVSSDASMISKSECKTLKLSVFDVDRSLMPLEEVTYDTNVSSMQYSTPPMSAPVSKRLLEHEQSVSLPPAKSSRTSYSDSPRPRSPPHRRSQSHTSPRVSENSHSKSNNDTPVNVKQEPEDPDLIEVEPDDIEPKRETPYMQIDYSSDVPHTQTSQAALERLSHPQSSHSQSPASSSSSFHQNVPHVPDYSDPGPSRGHPGDQTTDDFLVFQDDNEDGDDNEADYSNDGTKVGSPKKKVKASSPSSGVDDRQRSGTNEDIVSRVLLSMSEDRQRSPSNEDVPSRGLHSTSEERQRALTIEDFASRGLLSMTEDRRRSLANEELASRNLLSLCEERRRSFAAEEYGTRNVIGQSFLCDLCGKSFTDPKTRKAHFEAIHENVKYSCPCGKVYKYPSGFRRHRLLCPLGITIDPIKVFIGEGSHIE